MRRLSYARPPISKGEIMASSTAGRVGAPGPTSPYEYPEDLGAFLDGRRPEAVRPQPPGDERLISLAAGHLHREERQAQRELSPSRQPEGAQARVIEWLYGNVGRPSSSRDEADGVGDLPTPRRASERSKSLSVSLGLSERHSASSDDVRHSTVTGEREAAGIDFTDSAGKGPAQERGLTRVVSLSVSSIPPLSEAFPCSGLDRVRSAPGDGGAAVPMSSRIAGVLGVSSARPALLSRPSRQGSFYDPVLRGAAASAGVMPEAVTLPPNFSEPPPQREVTAGVDTSQQRAVSAVSGCFSGLGRPRSVLGDGGAGSSIPRAESLAHNISTPPSQQGIEARDMDIAPERGVSPISSPSRQRSVLGDGGADSPTSDRGDGGTTSSPPLFESRGAAPLRAPAPKRGWGAERAKEQAKPPARPSRLAPLWAGGESAPSASHLSQAPSHPRGRADLLAAQEMTVREEAASATVAVAAASELPSFHRWAEVVRAPSNSSTSTEGRRAARRLREIEEGTWRPAHIGALSHGSSARSSQALSDQRELDLPDAPGRGEMPKVAGSVECQLVPSLLLAGPVIVVEEAGGGVSGTAQGSGFLVAEEE